MHVNDDGCTKVLLTNTSGATCKLEKGECVGMAFEAVTKEATTPASGESEQARSADGNVNDGPQGSHLR